MQQRVEGGRTRMHTLLSCPTAMRLSCDHATVPGYGDGVSRSARSQGMMNPHPHPKRSGGLVAFQMCCEKVSVRGSRKNRPTVGPSLSHGRIW
jgi:hypothetical protein